MTAKVKVGLIAGVIGLVVNIPVSAFIGICGPVTALLAGAVAGFLAARQEKPATQGEGTGAGAVAGAIAGGLVLIGQIIGGIIATQMLQSLGAEAFLELGDLLEETGMTLESATWIAGLGTGVCLGLFGVILSALAGAAAGYLGTPKQTAGSSEAE